jgi:hypothetical protein
MRSVTIVIVEMQCVIYPECVFVALVIQYEKRMHLIVTVKYTLLVTF